MTPRLPCAVASPSSAASRTAARSSVCAEAARAMRHTARYAPTAPRPSRHPCLSWGRPLQIFMGSCLSARGVRRDGNPTIRNREGGHWGRSGTPPYPFPPSPRSQHVSARAQQQQPQSHRPGDRSRRDRWSPSAPSYQPSVACRLAPASAPARRALSRRCASTPNSTCRRSRSSIPRL